MNNMRDLINIIENEDRANIARIVKHISSGSNKDSYHFRDTNVRDTKLTFEFVKDQTYEITIIPTDFIIIPGTETNRVIVVTNFVVENPSRKVVGMEIGSKLKRELNSGNYIKTQLLKYGFTQAAINEFINEFKVSLHPGIDEYTSEITNTSSLLQNELYRAIRYKISLDEFT